MEVGDVVRVQLRDPHGSGSIETTIAAIEPSLDWAGRDLDGWIDSVVLRFPCGRRLRFKRGIVEESPRFQHEPRLAVSA